jgi:hypothetical protein
LVLVLVLVLCLSQFQVQKQLLSRGHSVRSEELLLMERRTCGRGRDSS